MRGSKGGGVNPPSPAPFEKFSNLFKPHCKIIEKRPALPLLPEKEKLPLGPPLNRDM